MIGNKFVHAIFIIFETALFIMVILLSVAIYAESKAEDTTTETFVGPPESTKRLITGNYFDCGLIFTDDGEIWEYTDNSVADENRVVVCLDYKNVTDPEDEEQKRHIEINMTELEYQDGTSWLDHFLK